MPKYLLIQVDSVQRHLTKIGGGLLCPIASLTPPGRSHFYSKRLLSAVTVRADWLLTVPPPACRVVVLTPFPRQSGAMSVTTGDANTDAILTSLAAMPTTFNNSLTGSVDINAAFTLASGYLVRKPHAGLSD